MQHQKWQCPKCKNNKFETGQLSGTGGFFSKFFNIQNQKFTTVSCSQCNYTEIYKGTTSTLDNVIDFFGN